MPRKRVAPSEAAAQLSAVDSISPLEQLRRKLALAVGENAVFDGWTRKAVDSAAARLGIDPAQARLAMPKTRAAMIDLYLQEVDRALEAWFTPERLAGQKIREKIRSLVWRRLEIMGPAREAIRRALAILAMPQNIPLAFRVSWRTADLMWRIAGDTSTDFNYYTKRMTLGAVYASTLLAWLEDQSGGWSETAKFLDRRIDDVMKFEKWKAGWRGSSDRRLSPSRFFGRLRYPPR
jgi:ubiquinone biosynthesis protein COQ9